MADSSLAPSRPSGFFTTQRLTLLLCLLALILYLKQSGQGEEMARSVWAELQLSRAAQELSEGDVAQATERLEAATDASERHSMHLRVGMLYSIAGMQNSALPHFFKAVASNPRDADAYYYLGSCLLKMNRQSEAVSAFEQALAIRPSDPILLNNIGYSYADEGIRLQEAEELVKRAVAMRPREGFILDSLGWVYFKQGRLMEALACLERAHRLTPGDPSIAGHLIKVREEAYSGEGPPPAR